jgi:hypothetical protein
MKNTKKTRSVLTLVLAVVAWLFAFAHDAAAATQVVDLDGDYFALNQINWNGGSHQQGGVAKIGGYMRNPLTAYDFETLARFDVHSIQGTVKSARLTFQVAGGQSFGPQTVELFQQDILPSFDPATVSYSTFNDGPFTSRDWTHSLGTVGVDSTQPGAKQIASAALTSLVQTWVSNPSSNAGVVLTGTFWYWDSFVTVTGVRLSVEVEGGAWVQVGETNILNFSPGGPHDFALAPDGTPFIAVRHVGPQSCPMCPPPLEPHVARFASGAWQDLNPAAFPLGEFPAVEVTSTGVPLVVVKNGAFALSGTTWSARPAIPSQFSHPFTEPELVASNDGSVFLSVRSSAGSSVLRLGTSSWTELGGGPLPLADAFSGPSVAVGGDGRPVVAVRGPNTGTQGNIDVLRFDGTSWVHIGPTIHADRVSTRIAIAVTPSGQPFVAFGTTFTTQTALALLTFDGTSWVGTGPVRVPGVASQGFTALAVSPAGVVYATAGSFDSASNTEGRTVVRFTGTDWVPVGPAYRIGNDVGGTETKLAVSQTGTPFVAYQNGTGITVKKFVP